MTSFCSPKRCRRHQPRCRHRQRRQPRRTSPPDVHRTRKRVFPHLGRQCPPDARHVRRLLRVGEGSQGAVFQAEHAPRRPRVRLSRQTDRDSARPRDRFRTCHRLHVDVPVLQYGRHRHGGGGLCARSVAVDAGTAVRLRQHELSGTALRIPRRHHGRLSDAVARDARMARARAWRGTHDARGMVLRCVDVRATVDAPPSEALPAIQCLLRRLALRLHPRARPLLLDLHEGSRLRGARSGALDAGHGRDIPLARSRGCLPRVTPGNLDLWSPRGAGRVRRGRTIPRGPTAAAGVESHSPR